MKHCAPLQLSARFLALVIALPALAGHATETNHNFARWEKEIAAFERADATNPPPKNAVLFIGSSTIRLWATLAQDFPEQRVINRGFGGSEIVDATHFADRIIFPYAPRAIFFRAGGNDVAAGKSPGQVFTNFQEFVATIHARLPETDIYYIACAYTIRRWTNRENEKALNDRIKEFARGQPHVKYIPAAEFVLGPDGQPRPELFVSDKLHFSAEGYKLLTDIVRPHLPKGP